MKITFAISLIILFQAIPLLGQLKDDSRNFDTSQPKENKIIIIKPTTPIDSSNMQGDRFFDSLKVKADQNNWSKQLHDLLVIDFREKSNIKIDNGQDRTNYFNEFTGKEIRHIEIQQMDVFGSSVYDTANKPNNWIQQFGNKVHISTLRSAIRGYLFFEKGEKVDPYIMFDNERILRTIPNIQDSRIFIVPVKGEPELVDVLILTKDVWPIGFGLEIFDVIYGNASVWNKNVLGTGHQLGYTAYYNSNSVSDEKYGYKLHYSIPNIGNSLTSINLNHQDIWTNQSSSAYLTRNFITPSLRIGGGIGYENNFTITSLITIDTIYYDTPIKYEFYELWGGYSIPIRTYDDHNIRKSLFISGRGASYKYLTRPSVSEKYLHTYHNRKSILGSMGVLWQGYQSTRLVYGFGDTEDLPFGGMLKFTGGHEFGEFSDRTYFSSIFSWSNFIKNLGYFSGSAEIGSYYNPNQEQGVLNLEMLHISPLLGNNRHSFRHFVNIKYKQGFNRFDDEYISIFDNEGIRGLNYMSLRGNKRFSINSETVYYSPQYIFGFRFVYFAYFDIASINYTSTTLPDNPLIYSVGVGVRVRNERLVFNTIQLRLNFFPFNQDIPDIAKSYFEYSGRGEYRIPDFAERKPEFAEY